MPRIPKPKEYKPKVKTPKPPTPKLRKGRVGKPVTKATDKAMKDWKAMIKDM